VETVGADYTAALQAGDPENSAPICGEAIGLIGSVEPAGDIVQRMVAEAEDALGRSR